MTLIAQPAEDFGKIESCSKACVSLADQVPTLEDIDTRGQNRWTEHKEQTIRGPYDYITSKPGKEFRTQLLSAFNVWLKVSPDSLQCISGVIRMLHNASLLVDDIQDNSRLRRGRPVAHSVFGVAQTINSANFVYFLALAELQKLPHSKEAMEIFTAEMLSLHRGQGMDLFWRDTLSCPSEDDYLEMVSNKTGGLFRLAIKLMQAECETKVDCMPLVNLLGLIFQITDDYRNLASLDYTRKKGFCEDLTEGKFSFPVVHSIHAQPGNGELLHILAQKPGEFEYEIKQHAVGYMENTGSFAYTRRAVEVLLAKARAAARELDAQHGCSNNAILALLDKVARL
ncbi:geranylgeranyl pyrophosphate synthetase [Microsporum canis]